LATERRLDASLSPNGKKEMKMFNPTFCGRWFSRTLKLEEKIGQVANDESAV
jgi:hypothetical protein